MKPNFEDCQQCPDWDDINGCWANCKSYCGKMDEEDFEDELKDTGSEGYD